MQLPVQAVITGLWAAVTVFASTFGYTTMRTGAHMADTGTEHNIELIVGVRCHTNFALYMLSSIATWFMVLASNCMHA